MKLLVFLLFTFLSFSQNKEIKFYITNVATEDTLKHFVKYSVDYELKNTSNHEIFFFNSTDNPLELNYRNTASIYADFSIYDDNSKLNDALFISTKHFLKLKHYSIISEGKSEIEQKTYQDSIRKILAIKRDTTGWSKKRDSVLKNKIKELNTHNDFDYIKKSIVNLKPNETIKGSLYFFWYKKRYRKIQDEEFYMDENPKNIELSIAITNPTEMKRYFNSKEFDKIKNNPNFINGTFVSNKMKIDFKE